MLKFKTLMKIITEYISFNSWIKFRSTNVHRAGLGPNPVQGAAGDGVDAALVLSPPCQPWVYSCSPCPEKGKAGEWPEESKIMPTTGLDKTSLRFIRPTESLGRTHLGRFQP